MSKLKRCPFCRGKATLTSGFSSFTVACNSTTCRVTLFITSYDGKDAVINAWNARAPSNKVQKIVNLLQKQAAQYEQDWRDQKPDTGTIVTGARVRALQDAIKAICPTAVDIAETHDAQPVSTSLDVLRADLKLLLDDCEKFLSPGMERYHPWANIDPVDAILDIKLRASAMLRWLDKKATSDSLPTKL
jgi:hypothetical protein